MSKAVDFSAAVKNGKTKKSQTPAKVDPFDLAPVKKRLVAVDKAVNDMAAVALAHKVTDADSNKLAVEMMGQNATLTKRIEALRKELVDPHVKFNSAVNALCKGYTDGKLKEIKAYLGKESGDYQYKQEMARREQERAVQEEARKLQEKLNAEAKEKGIEAPEVLAPVMPEKQTTTRTEMGTAHLRIDWVFEIEDAAQVPREYCEPSDKRIRQAVQGGARTIPGVRIFEKRQTVVNLERRAL